MSDNLMADASGVEKSSKKRRKRTAGSASAVTAESLPKDLRRFALVEDFNPLSPPQVMAYLKAKGYKIPLDRKTLKPTSNKETLSKLGATYQDPVLWETLDARKLSKAAGYLTDAIVGRDGRIHSTFTFAPDTGRLASFRPNVQNVPRTVDQAIVQAIRSTIIPSEGCEFVELDWKAIEAVLTGWFANDQDYIALSLADSHSYYGWHIMYAMREEWARDVGSPPPMADRLLSSRLDDWKRKHGGWQPLLSQGVTLNIRDLAKKVNHASSYGMGPKHMGEILRLSPFLAAKLLRIKDEMAPKVKAWKRTVLVQAHTQGYLENPFGYRHCFWNVVEVKGGKPSVSEEANKAFAFLPQSTAAAMLREVLLDLPALAGYHEWWWPLCPIHDAILVEVKKEKIDESVDFIRRVMERKWRELGGLSVPVDAKLGHGSWATVG